MHPYKQLPDHAYWRRAMGEVRPADVDPVLEAPFDIGATDRVVTAGSCFAQHIGRHLRECGFNFWITEPAHPLVPESAAHEFSYGVYSARYGNVYTTRQLVQLFRRAFGQFHPVEDFWLGSHREFIDPFRPQVQPGGFMTEREYARDREQHFAAVQEAFRGLAVFVFTLGLTECWMAVADGAVYPLCPGVVAGEFDPSKYKFVNLSVDEVFADLREFVNLLRAENPSAKVILTVSPVPLIATADRHHVLRATTYSKAVLRVACEMAERALDGVFYFPSYEIVTGPHARGRYFSDDLRSVTNDGVSHVMRLFLAHYAGVSEGERPRGETIGAAVNDIEIMSSIIKTMCDEEMLDAVDLT